MHILLLILIVIVLVYYFRPSWVFGETMDAGVRTSVSASGRDPRPLVTVPDWPPYYSNVQQSSYPF